MDALTDFLNHMDWQEMIFFLMSAVAALLCITIHEVCHGLTAYWLGDATAKRAGRLTLNPISHLDLIGLAMMVTVRIGWAKPVPVDMRNFKNPKAGMAITALAGPVSNFLLATLVLAVGSALYHFAPVSTAVAYVLLFLCYMAVLSVGLGLFNLIPIPPLDGSKVLFSLLPDKIYLTILRYERFVILAVVLLMWSGLFSAPLSLAMEYVVGSICKATFFPADLFYLYGFF